MSTSRTDRLDLHRIGNALLSHMRAAVYVSDVDRVIRYLNPACERLLGDSARAVVGRKCHDVFGNPERPCGELCAAEVATKAGWTPSEHRARFRVASGELQDFRTTCITVLDDDGVISHVVHVFETVDADTAPWARLEESEARYRMLFNHLTDAVFIASDSGGILEANDEACRRFGYSRSEFLSLSAADFDSDEFKSQVAERMRRIVEHGQHVFESAHVSRDGTEIPVEVNARRFEMGGTTAVLAVCRDIRERRRADEAQRQAHTDLERANQKLQRLNEQLAGLEQLKTDLLTNVSHELRTPLVTVRGYTDLMEAGRLGPTSQRQQKALAVMQISLQKLLVLIDRLLDFSRLDSGQQGLSVEEVDLCVLASGVVTALQPKADEAKVTVALRVEGGSCVLEGDPSLLEQLVSNLLDNAIEFNRAGGRVDLTLAPMSEDRVRIVVSDTGIGIAPDQQARVFERFHQVDTTSTREHGGAGIGLSLARAIALQHGGEIRLTSEPGEGSCFTAELPRRPPGRTT